jgi:hypothetical protein
MKNSIIQIANELYAYGGDHEGSVGVDLDETSVLKFYPVDGKLFVVFDVAHDLREVALLESAPTEGSKFKLNKHAMLKYQKLIGTIVNDLVNYLHYASEELDLEFSETIYVGGGVGGCLAVLTATKSPPHQIITFGMPPFCSNEVLEEISQLDDERAERMELQGLIPSAPFMLWNLQDVYESATRKEGGTRHDTLGDVYWSDCDGGLHYNPSWLKRTTHEFFTRKNVTGNVTNYSLPDSE